MWQCSQFNILQCEVYSEKGSFNFFCRRFARGWFGISGTYGASCKFRKINAGSKSGSCWDEHCLKIDNDFQ